MIFRRGKNKNQLNSPEHEPAATPESAEQPRHFADVVSDRVRAIRNAQETFLREAIERGVPPSELAQVTADAMNAGVLPCVTLGMLDRNSNIQLQLFDGQIPAAAIRAEVDDSPDQPRAVIAARRIENSGDFSIKTTTRLPQLSRLSWNNPRGIDPAETLAEIDAHLPSGLVEPAQIIEQKPFRPDYDEFGSENFTP